MTRLVYLLLMFTVALLAGCGPSPSGPDDTAKEGKTLTLWHIMNYSGPREVLAGAVTRFENRHPGVQVRVQTFDNDAYKTKLAVETAAGRMPDVFFTWGGGGLAEMANAGRVLDLTAHVENTDWRSRFLPQALQLCMSEGNVYAVPLDLSCVPVWYNRELFSQLSIDPPETMADVYRISEVLKENDVIPFALGNRKQWPGAFHFIYLATRAGGAPLFFGAAAGESGEQFDDPAFIRAGRELRRMVEADLFPVGFNGMEAAQARTRFLQGEAGMYLMGTWLVARVKGENPEFAEKLDCFRFPMLTDGAGNPDTMVGGVNCGFAVAASSPHPELAVDLLRELTSEKTVAEWCRIGRIPALGISEAQVASLAGPTRAALRLLHTAPVLQPYYDQYLPPRLAEVHKKTTQELFAGTATPREAAARMEKAARRSRQ